jgi:hypothetical protein
VAIRPHTRSYSYESKVRVRASSVGLAAKRAYEAAFAEYRDALRYRRIDHVLIRLTSLIGGEEHERKEKPTA